jgi:bacillolysin
LYPNPALDVLSISIKENKAGSYKIYNSLGFEIQKGQTSGGTINVSNLNQGIYYFEFNNGEKTVVKTFLKK